MEKKLPFPQKYDSCRITYSTTFSFIASFWGQENWTVFIKMLFNILIGLFYKATGLFYQPTRFFHSAVGLCYYPTHFFHWTVGLFHRIDISIIYSLFYYKLFSIFRCLSTDRS